MTKAMLLQGEIGPGKGTLPHREAWAETPLILWLLFPLSAREVVVEMEGKEGSGGRARFSRESAAQLQSPVAKLTG